MDENKELFSTTTQTIEESKKIMRNCQRFQDMGTDYRLKSINHEAKSFQLINHKNPFKIVKR